MPTSAKKVASNRINAQKSQGPINTTSTRFNATKHGLLAQGITELDDADSYHALLSNLRQERAPVGPFEELLVESIALEIVRLARARRFEAEYITAELNPPIHDNSPFGDELTLLQGPMLDPGLPAAMSSDSTQRLVSIFQRYESIFLNRILRFFHELERLQRIRSGENLPAPTFVDVSVHASKQVPPAGLKDSPRAEIVVSAPAAVEQSESLLSDDNQSVQRESETLDSVVAAPEQPKNLSGNLDVNARPGIETPDSQHEVLEEPKAIDEKESEWITKRTQ
jgi:hypothetical protein